jgi:hypothetical protein
MRHACLLAALMCLTAHAQIMQQLKKTVAFVYGEAHVKDKDGKHVLVEGPLGTAFFVFYPDKRGGEGYGFTYVVTAKHVLKDELEGKYLDKIRLRLNRKTGTGVGFALLQVSDSKGNLLWLDDRDDPNANIALSLGYPSDEEVDYQKISIQSFADSDTLKKSNVSEGDSVYLIGLMPQFTGETRNYPVVRHGSIALLSDEPIPIADNVKQHVYAVELGSWPGHSGAPVFLSLGGYRNGAMNVGDSYSLLGLMLGYFENARPFEAVAPTNSVWLGDTSNIGISYVLPASEILKVLQSKEAQQERDADILSKSDRKSPPVPSTPPAKK